MAEDGLMQQEERSGTGRWLRANVVEHPRSMQVSVHGRGRPDAAGGAERDKDAGPGVTSGMALLELPAEALLEVVAVVLEGGLGFMLSSLALVSKRFATAIVPAFRACRMSAARPYGAYEEPCRGGKRACPAEERVRICRQCLASSAGACAACDECNARVLACASCGRLQRGCWHLVAGAVCASCARPAVCGECTAVCSVSRLLGADGGRACRSCACPQGMCKTCAKLDACFFCGMGVCAAAARDPSSVAWPAEMDASERWLIRVCGGCTRRVCRHCWGEDLCGPCEWAERMLEWEEGERAYQDFLAYL